MAIFKVGDRVRIVATNLWPHLMGLEGTLLSFNPLASNSEEGVWAGWYINVDGHGERVPNGRRLCIRERCIVPIAKPRQEVTDWSKSLCRPDGSYNPSGDHLPAMTPEFARAWGGA